MRRKRSEGELYTRKTPDEGELLYPMFRVVSWIRLKVNKPPAYESTVVYSRGQLGFSMQKKKGEELTPKPQVLVDWL